MGGFTKLHGTIIHSSIWGEDSDTRVLWITMLAMADGTGTVYASVGGLARAAGISRDVCERGLAKFLAPDPDSRDGTTGERIQQVEGGWYILNHSNYRDRQTREQELAAERQRRFRARRKKVTGNEVTKSHSYAPLSRSNSVEPSASASVSASASGSSPPTKPKKKKKKKNTEGAAEMAKRPDDVDPDLWSAFLANRKAKKKPLTLRAWQLLDKKITRARVSRSEALSEAIEYGWADWGANWKRGNLDAPGASRKKYVAASKVHIPNTPLGNQYCQCDACISYREKHSIGSDK